MVGSVRRHRVRDRGAQTVEYGALFLLIAAILAALLAAGIPRALSAGVESAICTIFAGGDCARPVAEPPGGGGAGSGWDGSGSGPNGQGGGAGGPV
ncbi:MAG: hypothetical protein ACRDOO_24445, partial [Actinomadura sp.]